MADQITRVGISSKKAPTEAIAELAVQIELSSTEAILFFCSSHYRLEELASAINERFSCTVLGCTTAGEIFHHYTHDTILAISFSSTHFRFQTQLISPLSNLNTGDSVAMKSRLGIWLEEPSEFPNSERFAICLIDGLSVMEEVFLGNISPALEGIPLVGGSAADDLSFHKTYIFSAGEFHADAAVIALVETRLGIRHFKFQHFQPSDREMVITAANPRERVVYEIDGAPAAEEYARILGLPIRQLTPQVFSTYPVMLQIGQQWYVRSIQKVNRDGSLTFYCAIDEGLPLTIARGIGFVETLSDQVSRLCEEFSSIELTLGFDCILRRLEIEQKNLQRETEEVLEKISFVGFSTYGEQFNTIHVNQTLTGVALGNREK